MKNPKHLMLACLALAIAPNQSVAQGYPFSQRGTVSQMVAFTNISIEYGRPVARGRALFGALVPWDSVWHPGADSATHPHEFLAVPSHASSISRLQPHLRVAFPPCPSGWVAFKTHNGRGPNPASFKRLYRKRPAETFHLDLEIVVTGSLPIQH